MNETTNVLFAGPFAVPHAEGIEAMLTLLSGSGRGNEWMTRH